MTKKILQVSVNRMGVISPQWQQPDLMFPSLFAPLRRKSNIYRHRSNSRLRANRRNSFQSRIQSRRHQPLTRRRRPATVVKSLPARKPTSKPKSGWKSWINILWGPKTPIWPLSLLQPQQQVDSKHLCALFHKIQTTVLAATVVQLRDADNI